eukprot:m51a1_g8798 hypothetical protein (121) ;mRNA; r:247311-247673
MDAKSMGAFEVPQELLASIGSGKEQPALFSQMPGNGASNSATKHEEENDEIAASMVSIMPLKMDSVALQMPREIGENGSFTMMSGQSATQQAITTAGARNWETSLAPPSFPQVESADSAV